METRTNGRSKAWGALAVVGAIASTAPGCQSRVERTAQEAPVCVVPGPFAGQRLPTDDGAAIALPPPATEGGTPLHTVLAERRSHRDYTEAALSLAEVSQLLWAGQGRQRGGERRTVPSAGALYPFEIYLVVERVEGLAPGLYHYRGARHELGRLREGHFAAELQTIAVDQAWVGASAVTVILLGVLPRIAKKYGGRAERFASMEAGAIAQSVLLQATDLGLGAVLVGGFTESKLQAFLGTDAYPMALVTLGRR